MSLRLLVVTAGLVILLMVLGVVLVGFRRRDIRDWIQNRKRVGAVYYVKAQTEPGSRRVQPPTEHPPSPPPSPSLCRPHIVVVYKLSPAAS
ncbi:unnamed protein product [Ixodes persulcatus]